MATYIIGYDLVKKSEYDYTNLIDAIKALGSWWHCLDSTWIVISALTAVQVRDTLRSHMHADDRLLVAVISSPSAWAGFGKDCSDWLKNNL